MRIANCEIVCREIDELNEFHEWEEFNAGQHLDTSVMEHVRGCARCRAFYDDRRKLRVMVANLETVEAPPDFDFRVRSRIANEKARPHSGLFFGSLSFGVPSIALAIMVLLLGVGLVVRGLKAPTNSETTQQTDTPAIDKSKVLTADQGTPAEKPDATLIDNAADTVKDEANKQGGPVPETGTRKRLLKSAVASERNIGRQVTREFSSMPAPVVKQEETIASLENFPIFPVEASSQPLRVSLDYATGISRTISVPALSFGSQRVLAGGGSPLDRTSSKGIW